MSDAFVGEIKMFAGSFVPKGWLPCDGQLLPIVQYQALFSLLGTMYGGDGHTNFAIPNLNGRAPMHFGNSHTIGESRGESSVTITINEMPMHSHSARLKGASQGNRDSPAGNVPGMLTGNKIYSQASGVTLGNMAERSAVIGNSGGSTAHQNMQPYLVMNFGICIYGTYPPRS
jgi:microcystin-dependent protein